MDAKKQKWLSGELAKIENREYDKRMNRIVVKASLVSKERTKLLEGWIDLILEAEEKDWKKGPVKEAKG